MSKLTKSDVMQIPRLINEGKSLFDIAAIYDVHVQSINHWVRRLRQSGKVLNIKRGRPYNFKL